MYTHIHVGVCVKYEAVRLTINFILSDIGHVEEGMGGGYRMSHSNRKMFNALSLFLARARALSLYIYSLPYAHGQRTSTRH